MTATIPVDAEAYAAMLRELQQYRSAGTYGGGLADVLRLRQGVITARDPTAYTVSVRLGGSDLSANVEGSEYTDVIDGVGLAAPVYPRVGDTCFVGMQGAVATVPTVLFTMGPVGAVRIIRATNQTVPQAVLTDTVFPSGSGTNVQENTDGMYNSAVRTDGITIQWPGRYSLGGGLRFANIDAGVSAVTSLRVGTVELVRDDKGSSSAASFPTSSVVVDANLTANQVVKLSFFANDANGVIEWRDEYSPVLFATWRSPD